MSKSISRLSRGGLVTLVTVVVAGCAAERPAEPVRFAAFQPELFAAGGALTDVWADFDLDGDPDRFVGFNGEPARLYRNDLLDGFADVAPMVGLDVARSIRTSAWGDFDGDGDPDLLLGFAGDGPVTALYRNDREAGFTEIAADVGLRLAEGATRQASWVDFDEDGDLDLFLAMRDRANLLFENLGPDGFENVAEEQGVADDRHTVGAVWFDVGDGRLDLVVANMDGDPNALFRQISETFEEDVGADALRAGGRMIGDATQGSVRPCVVDFDNDGDFDLSFANYGPNGLLEHDGAGGFVNVADRVRLADESRYDTCAWGDFDHDGRVDLYVNGTVGGGVHYRDWLMRREGGDVFMDVTPPELLRLNASHGATWVDYDLDGDLDLSLAGAAPDGMHLLMENLLRPEFAPHSLHIRVVDGAGTPRPGAEVRLYAAGTRRLLGSRIVDTGSSYDGQSDLPVHFGLPGAQPVDVEVTILIDGERRVLLVERIDPREHVGIALTLRVGADANLIR